MGRRLGPAAVPSQVGEDARREGGKRADEDVNRQMALRTAA